MVREIINLLNRFLVLINYIHIHILMHGSNARRRFGGLENIENGSPDEH